MGYHSGTPDSASLAAQQAAGQTDLVSPAARAAAEALAAAQSTAIITRIGLLEYICANDVDPSVSAPAALSTALVGARVTTLDGTRAWIRYNTGSTDWSSMKRTKIGPVTIAGASVNYYDLAVDVPTDRMVKLCVDWVPDHNTGVWTRLRLNGETATGVGNHTLNGNFTASTGFVPIGYGSDTYPARCELEIGKVFGGGRSYHVTHYSGAGVLYSGRGFGLLNNNVALTHVGLFSESANAIKAGTVIQSEVFEVCK